MNGNLLSIEKLAEKKQEQEDSGGMFTHGHRKIKNYPSIIIEAVNQTGDTLDEFTCLRIIGGATPDDMSDAVYPEDIDDKEDSLYGSLIEDEIMPGQVCHVQIFGEAKFTLKSSMTVPFITGELAYPMPNGSSKGTISNKISDTTIIKNPLGRTLQDDGTDSTLAKVLLTNSGGNGTENSDVALFADDSTTPALSGFTATDGITPVDGSLVFIPNATITTDRGMWIAHSGAWTKADNFTPKIVGVFSGTTYALTFWLLDGTTYTKVPQGSSVGSVVIVRLTSTANISTSGAQTFDGQTTTTGDLILASAQTTPANRGVYIANNGGAWTHHTTFQPTVCFVVQGTVGAGLYWFLSAANTYTKSRSTAIQYQ